METKDIFGNEAKTEVKTAKSADVKKTTTRKTPAKAAAKETVKETKKEAAKTVETVKKAADAPESLLSRMTGGVHLHTLRCPDKDTFARIRDALEQQGLLYRKE